MKVKIFTLTWAIALIAWVLPAMAEVAVEEWVETYNGYGNGYDSANAIAVDATGYVYVTGHATNTINYYDIVTIKYATDGTEEWTKIYNGTGNGSDSANAIAVDTDGNAYVTGKTWNGSNTDIVTIKYATDGTEEWTKVYNGTGNGYDEGEAICVDVAGNVYVTGYGYNGSSVDYVIFKYSTDGTEEWTKVYNGTGNGSDYANDIAVDAAGNVYVTGHSYSGSNEDYVTIKYTTDGTEEWLKAYNGTGNRNDYGEAITVDSDGNAYVTGKSRGVSSDDYVTIKYATDGTEEWTETYNGTGNGYDVANAIAVDAAGKVYVTGYSTNTSNNYDIVTIKYATDGTEEWTKVYNGTGNGYDFARVICVDADGNVYVTGNSNDDYVTIKYDTDGTEEWTKVYNGTGNGSDNANGICVDADGNVYVTGNSNDDYVTIKYASDEETAIELLSFNVSEVTGSVSLTWVTATEAGNAGFHLLRAGAANGDYQRITSSLLPAEGSEFSGASYEFTDSDVEAGETYFYFLEDIDINGVSTFHGPVNVTLEGESEFGCGVVEGSNYDFALVLLVLGMAIIGGGKMKKGYSKPEVKTTSSSEVVKKIGPAQTCSPSPSECPTAQ